MLRRSRNNVSIPGIFVRCLGHTERVVLEAAEIPSPLGGGGHLLQVCRARPDGDGKVPEDHPDHNPAPLEEEFPAVARVACQLDRGVLAVVHSRQLHVH